MISKVKGYQDKETGFISPYPPDDLGDADEIEAWQAECGCLSDTLEEAEAIGEEQRRDEERLRPKTYLIPKGTFPPKVEDAIQKKWGIGGHSE